MAFYDGTKLLSLKISTEKHRSFISARLTAQVERQHIFQDC